MFMQLSIIVSVLICVALLTVGERKLIAAAQRRRGPGVSGVGGLAQPFWDGLKLALKEPVMPSAADQPCFIWAPVVSLVLSQAMWAYLPLDGWTAPNAAATSLQAVTLLALSSLAVYGILFAGYSSNSRYALLGSCRSVAQMVSYELPLGITVLCLSTRAPNGDRSMSLSDMLACQLAADLHLWMLWPLALAWVVGVLAETNRAPFDLPEAEAELVAGYNVEYSAMAFALFFIAEYANLAAMGALTSVYFLGASGVGAWLPLKLSGLVAISVWVRATLPRFRYDQLMSMGWKLCLPACLAVCFVHVTMCTWLGLEWCM